MNSLKTFSVPLMVAVSVSSLVAQTTPTTNASVQSPPAKVLTQPKGPVLLSWPANEVLKMANANVDRKIISAFIQNYQHRYDLTADQILQLKNAGLPSDLIAQMLEHDAKMTQRAEAAPATPPTAPSPSEPAVAPESEPEPEPTESSDVYSAPYSTTDPSIDPATSSGQLRTFYETLAPYGTWINLNGYGWCWQPKVAALNPGWRPYFDNGRWLYSDAGWYWNSYYPWGWAPFHYGRWWKASVGWVWFPDTLWAPSWVTWRYSDPYCGWAPLPPYRFYSGYYPYRYPYYYRGYYGSHFAANLGFRLGSDAFVFVGFNNVFKHDLKHHKLHHSHVNKFFHHSKSGQHFSRRSDNVFVNKGVSINHVERFAGKAPRVTVSQRFINPKQSNPDRITRVNQMAIVDRPSFGQQVKSRDFSIQPRRGTDTFRFSQRSATSPWVSPSLPQSRISSGQSLPAARSSVQTRTFVAPRGDSTQRRAFTGQTTTSIAPRTPLIDRTPRSTTSLTTSIPQRTTPVPRLTTPTPRLTTPTPRLTTPTPRLTTPTPRLTTPTPRLTTPTPRLTTPTPRMATPVPRMMAPQTRVVPGPRIADPAGATRFGGAPAMRSGPSMRGSFGGSPSISASRGGFSHSSPSISASRGSFGHGPSISAGGRGAGFSRGPAMGGGGRGGFSGGHGGGRR